MPCEKRHVVVLLAILGLALCGSAGREAGAEPGASQPERIAELIERLGADAFAERRAAERALIEIGEPARSAIEEATRSDDLEVAARARSVLRSLGERRVDQRLERFVETGRIEGRPWPLAETYLAAVGEMDEPSGQLLRWMLSAEGELLEAADLAARLAADEGSSEAERDEAKRAYLTLADQRLDWVADAHLREVKRAKPGLYGRYELTKERIGQFMAMTLAWRIVPAEWQPGRPGRIAQTMAFGTVLGKQDQRNGWPPFSRWFTSKAEEVEPARKLMQSVAARLPGTNESLSFLSGAMVMRLDQSSVILARSMADRFEALSSNGQVLALHTLMLWGEKEKDLALAGRFLDSDGERRLGGFKGRAPDRRSIKVAEVALMTLRKLESGRTADRDARKVVTYCPVARWVPTFLYMKADQLKAEIDKWKGKLPDDRAAGAGASSDDEDE